MIGWSISAALEAGCFGRVIVSTDDEEIAAVARAEGAEVPFLRPAGLADDHATTIAVVQHALAWLEADGSAPERLCCLYATAPFVRAGDIAESRRLLDTAQYAVTVTSYGFPIQRALRIGDAGGLEMFDPGQALTRSQDLEEAWHDAGQFYWGRPSAWAAGLPIFAPHTAPIRIPRWRVQDIDTEEDWRRAELMSAALSASPQDR